MNQNPDSPNSETSTENPQPATIATAPPAPERYFGIPEAALSIALCLVAAVVVWGTWGMEFWRDTTPGPAFLPLAMAGMITLCATWLLIRRGPANTVSSSELRAAGTYLGLLIVSAAIFMWAGALVTIALFVFAELRLLQKRTYLYSLITGIAAAAGVWLVFVVALRVRLPLGFLSSLFV